MAEWLKATDCKSVLARVRWFESTPAQVYQEGASPLFQWMRTTQTDRFVIGSSDVRAECGANFAFGGAEYFISVIANLFFTCFIFNI